MNRRMANDLRAWLRTHSGLITHAEALRLGLTEAQIRRQVGTAAWARGQPGVYQDRAAVRGPMQAVVAACASTAAVGAVGSHLTAAWLWDLIESAPAEVHLTFPA